MPFCRKLILRILSDGSVYLRDRLRSLRGKTLGRANAVPICPMESAPNPFASVWDEASIAEQRRLLKRVVAVAEAHNIRLYLFWGTLIGQVREGRILAWDDDVDLAIFDPAGGQYVELREALQAAGLKTHDLTEYGDKWLKVYDPAYSFRTKHPWSWPFVDIFTYSELGTLSEHVRRTAPIPRHLILPGRLVPFEGVQCWEPERPLDLLDRQYPGWRFLERSSFWNHRKEEQNPNAGSRSIVTGKDGRKVADLEMDQL